MLTPYQAARCSISRTKHLRVVKVNERFTWEFQKFWFSATECRFWETIVFSIISAWRVNCRRYAVVVICFTSWYTKILKMNLATNWRLFPVGMCVGMA